LLSTTIQSVVAASVFPQNRRFRLGLLGVDEIKEFDKLEFGRLSWLQRVLESKILAATQVIISGETFGAESLQQAHTLQTLAEQINTEEQRAKATHPHAVS
jgi:hypothetical protein